MADTRKERRTPVSLKVRFKSGTVDEFIEQYSIDLSRSGLFIKSKTPMSVGTLLKFELQLKDESRLVHGVGRVVWSRSPEQAGAQSPGMGIKFVKIDPESRAFVQQVVDARGDEPGTFDLGVSGGGRPPMTPAESGGGAGPSRASGSFFPPGQSKQPAPEDRTNVRHASEFLESALSGTQEAAGEAKANADRARRRTAELQAEREAAVRRGAEDVRAKVERRSAMEEAPQIRTEGSSVEERAMKAAEIVPSHAEAAVPNAIFDDEADEPTRIAPFQSGALDLAALDDEEDEPTRIAPMGDVPVASVFPLVGDATDVGDPSLRVEVISGKSQAPAPQARASQAPAPQAPAPQARASQAPAPQAPAPQAPAPQARASQAPAPQAPAPQAPAPAPSRKATMRWDPAAAATLAQQNSATNQAARLAAEASEAEEESPFEAVIAPGSAKEKRAFSLLDDNVATDPELDQAKSVPGFVPTEMDKPAYDGALPLELPMDGDLSSSSRLSDALVGPATPGDTPRASYDILAPAAVEESTPAVGVPAIEDALDRRSSASVGAAGVPGTVAEPAEAAVARPTRTGLWVGIAAAALLVGGVVFWSLSGSDDPAPGDVGSAALAGSDGVEPPQPLPPSEELPPAAEEPAAASETPQPGVESAAAEPPAEETPALEAAAAEPPPAVEPGNVAVEIRSNPPGAEIHYQRRRRGSTPVMLELPIGEPAKITARRSGKVQVVELTPQEGQSPVDFDFVTKPFVIQFFTDPPGARVRSAGRYTRSPGRLDWEVFPNAVAVRVTMDGYETIQEVIHDHQFTEADGTMVYRFVRTLTPKGGGASKGGGGAPKGGEGGSKSGGTGAEPPAGSEGASSDAAASPDDG